ncbi:protein MTSS 2-like isoform X1 [Lates japonicus]|uniref:Protein MTSS 2-like isoform X1 n=1 Tax=Lates japonicus TaxID=270547 RepID=A0AAD3MLA7_LATJO|nr:protein MTSS 2-like isoform X1 [Lates japonicus]
MLKVQSGTGEIKQVPPIPRHSNIAQNYRGMIQPRPASTSGLPSGVLDPGVHGIPGQPGVAGGGVGGELQALPPSGVLHLPNGREALFFNAGPIPIDHHCACQGTYCLETPRSPGAKWWWSAGGGHAGGCLCDWQ